MKHKLVYVPFSANHGTAVSEYECVTCGATIKGDILNEEDCPGGITYFRTRLAECEGERDAALADAENAVKDSEEWEEAHRNLQARLDRLIEELGNIAWIISVSIKDNPNEDEIWLRTIMKRIDNLIHEVKKEEGK